MKRSYSFNVWLYVTISREHRIRVTGEAMPVIPARINCSNDDACPAEGGEIEVGEIFLICTSNGKDLERKLSKSMVNTVTDLKGFYEDLEEAMPDDSQPFDDYDDDREERAERLAMQED
jgi:hypothetical protein